MRLWLVLILALLAGNARAQEQRCSDIEGAGGHCLCSETLDTTGFTHIEISGNRDGATPTNADTKRCGGSSESVYFPLQDPNTEEQLVVPVPETGLPAGNSVSYVWRTHHPGDFRMSLNGANALPAGAKRVCARYYFRLSSDYLQEDPPADCESASPPAYGMGKIADLSWASLKMQMTMGHSWDPPNFEWWGSGTTLSATDWPGTNFRNTDCVAHWCRAEMCVSANNGFANLSTIYGSGRVENMDTPSRYIQWDNVAVPGTWTLGENLDLSYIMDGHRDPAYCIDWGAIPTSVYRDTSYVMQAAWTTDAGQFIGAASEVEGGSVVYTNTPVLIHR